ncbi:MAG: response regulator transcription factor [Pseudomonas sp.]|nr:response regulator transcription factor [Pseudomonas sp.]
MNSSHQYPIQLLLIEDDIELREHLRTHFVGRGFTVTCCDRGDTGLQLAERQAFDLILLDIMLPGLDGLGVLARLRREQGIPVILMSALGAEQDRIAGFTQGADDYLPKPFSLAELNARVDALLRRVAMDRRAPAALPVDSQALQLNADLQDVALAGRNAGLTSSEYRLLVTLQQHAGEALSKAFLYQQVLHRGYTRLDRGLDVHVCNLRRKLAAIEVRDLQIQAVRNQGYVLVRAG